MHGIRTHLCGRVNGLGSKITSRTFVDQHLPLKFRTLHGVRGVHGFHPHHTILRDMCHAYPRLLFILLVEGLVSEKYVM